MNIQLSLPAIILLLITFSGLLITANEHGKNREGKHNFWVSLVANAIILGILYWGGLFSK